MLAPHPRSPLNLTMTGLALAATAAVSLAAAGDDAPKLAGNWSWSWKDTKDVTHRHVLEVEGVGDKLAAREQFDEETPVRVDGLSLAGNKVKFAVVRDGRRAEYNGVVADESTINGTVTVTVDGQSTEFVWKARREPGPKPAPAR